MAKILDKSLVYNHLVTGAAMINEYAMLYFPRSRYQKLRGQAEGRKFNPKGVWQAVFFNPVNETCVLKRVLSSTPQSPCGQEVRLPLSAVLGNAKSSIWPLEKPENIGEGNLSKSGAKHVCFVDPEKMKGCSGRFSSVFGVYSVQRIDQEYSKFTRVAVWLGSREKVAPKLGGTIIDSNRLAEFFMTAVDMSKVFDDFDLPKVR